MDWVNLLPSFNKPCINFPISPPSFCFCGFYVFYLMISLSSFTSQVITCIITLQNPQLYLFFFYVLFLMAASSFFSPPSVIKHFSVHLQNNQTILHHHPLWFCGFLDVYLILLSLSSYTSKLSFSVHLTFTSFN